VTKETAVEKVVLNNERPALHVQLVLQQLHRQPFE